MSTARKSIVVQPSRVNRGRAVRAAVGDIDGYDLVLAVGDRQNDDVFELFHASSHSFTVTLGKCLSRAAFYVDEEEVLPTLQTLAAVSTADDDPRTAGTRSPAPALSGASSFVTAPNDGDSLRGV